MLKGIGRTSRLLRSQPWQSRFMVTAADVEGILKSQLAAQDVQVVDTSGGCGASFEVAVVTEQFEGKKLLERHRMVGARRLCSARAAAADRHCPMLPSDCSSR